MRFCIMKVAIKREKAETSKVDILIIPAWQETSLTAKSPTAQLDACVDGLLSDYIGSGDFSGSLNSTSLLRTKGKIPAPRVLLVGLGKPDAFTVDHLRQASASAATTARKLGVRTMAMVPPACHLGLTEVAQAIVEGALLGLYTLKAFKTVQDDEEKDQLQQLYLLTAGGSAQQALAKGV